MIKVSVKLTEEIEETKHKELPKNFLSFVKKEDQIKELQTNELVFEYFINKLNEYIKENKDWNI